MNWLKRKLQRLSPPKPPVNTTAAEAIGLAKAPEGTFWRISPANSDGHIKVALLQEGTNAQLAFTYVFKEDVLKGAEGIAHKIAWRTPQIVKEYLEGVAKNANYEQFKDCLTGDYR